MLCFQSIAVIYEGLFYAKTDGFVYCNPIASNVFAGTFVGTLKIEKTYISLRQGLQATIRFPPPISVYFWRKVDINSFSF